MHSYSHIYVYKSSAWYEYYLALFACACFFRNFDIWSWQRSSISRRTFYPKLPAFCHDSGVSTILNITSSTPYFRSSAVFRPRNSIPTVPVLQEPSDCKYCTSSQSDRAQACASYTWTYDSSECVPATSNSDLTATVASNFGTCSLRNGTSGTYPSTTETYAWLVLQAWCGMQLRFCKLWYRQQNSVRPTSHSHS